MLLAEADRDTSEGEQYDLAKSRWGRVMGIGSGEPDGADGARDRSGGADRDSASNNAAVKAVIVAAIIGMIGTILAALITGGFGLLSGQRGLPNSPSPGPAAGSTTTAQPPGTPSVGPTDSTSSSEVPAGFLGTWSGTQFQSEQPPPMYPTTMTFNAGRRNDEIGIADYPSPEVNCTFSLKLVGATAASMDASASVIKGHCIGPEMRFTLLGPGSAKYDLYYEGRRVGYGELSKDQM